MKKRIKLITAVIAGTAILLGAIWLINESRYPNVPAFDDHFTRKFLNKDKKVSDGFYEFKSKTNQYTMWFPEEYQVLHKYRENTAKIILEMTNHMKIGQPLIFNPTKMINKRTLSRLNFRRTTQNQNQFM
ncbi:hypothetical protein BMG_4648 [Priestia megaterium]|uniref:hypothetical protein n=1 Tax=Priestia megaterium TaxID=1404 RepID=UPI000B0B317C|nr:hypothetical protein [Priestia megaterium]QLK08085.1 hypothetical protein BMG_4648 [Priestia megaterium]